jgi:hypothetical protein
MDSSLWDMKNLEVFCSQTPPYCQHVVKPTRRNGEPPVSISTLFSSPLFLCNHSQGNRLSSALSNAAVRHRSQQYPSAQHTTPHHGLGLVENAHTSEFSSGVGHLKLWCLFPSHLLFSLHPSSVLFTVQQYLFQSLLEKEYTFNRLRVGCL